MPAAKTRNSFKIVTKELQSKNGEDSSVDEKRNISLLSVKNLHQDVRVAKSTPTTYPAIYAQKSNLGCYEAKIKSEDEQKSNLGKYILWPQVVAALAASFVNLGLGVIGGYTGVVLPELTNPNSTDVYMNLDQASLFSSINTIGYIVGLFITGFNMTWFGQRISLLIALPFGICGWITLAMTSHTSLLIFSRFMTGLLGGTCMSASRFYVVEISYPSVRGRLTAILDLMRQLGFVLVTIIGSTRLHWRFVALIGGLISLIPPLIVLSFLPNSPRWLATKGRRDEAKESLQFFRGNSYDVDKELSEVFNQLEEKSSKNSSIVNQLKLLNSRKLRQRFIVLSIMMFLAHWTGNVITGSYTVVIFQSAKTGIDEYMSSVVSTSMRLFGAMTYILIADKIKRKYLLIVPLFFASLSMATLGTYFFLMLDNSVEYISWLPLASLVVYLYSTPFYFSALLLSSSELLPNSVRTVGGSLQIFFLAVGMFICVYTYPYIIEGIGSHWAYWLYSLNAFIILLLALLFIPETKGKPLEEIENIK